MISVHPLGNFDLSASTTTPHVQIHPRVMHNREIHLANLLLQKIQSRLVLRKNDMIFDNCSKTYRWSVQGHSEPTFIWCHTQDSERFVMESAHSSSSRLDSNNTADFFHHSAHCIFRNPMFLILCGVDVQ